MGKINPDEVLLKPKSKEFPDVLERAVKPLIPIWTFGKGKTIQPYIGFRDLNCGEGKAKPCVEAGIKITF
jgi:hypothetical protein